MTESAFWQRVHTGLKAGARHIGWANTLRLDRIENSACAGTADVAGVVAGVDFWLELKVARGFRVKFQPGQVAWLESRWRCGSRAFVLVAKADSVLLYQGEYAGDLARYGVGRPLLYGAAPRSKEGARPDAAWRTPMRVNQWAELLTLIRGGEQ